MPPSVRIDLTLQLSPTNFILRKTLEAAANANINLTSAVLYVRKQQVISSVTLGIEKLRATGINIKLLVPHTITNKREIVTGSSSYTIPSFIKCEIP